MRNLNLRFCNRIDSKTENIKYVLTDPNGGKKNADSKLYLVTENQVYSTNEKLENITELVVKDDIVGAEYLALNDEICIATSDGRVLSIEPGTGTINENSYCDVGLLSMAWSPEQEVVVFITKSLNVVVMTCTYDPISEHVLQKECDQSQQFINVGWGRKETQFHGSEGKSAAKQTNTFEKPEDIEDEINDVTTTWRFDGAYFAVSFVSMQYGRMFKVFDKEGTLQYTSEKMNGLKAPISWRPSGTWIAMPHALPNKSTIALFEKNGLRHREIVVPFNFADEKVVSLNWSTESDILAIQTELVRGKRQQVYLYTIGNYHWYLKQTLAFAEGEEIVHLQFGNDDVLERTLNIMLNTGEYLKYSWFFGVDKFEKDGIVAVIDGKKLLLTNFSKAIVPPPMSSAQIEIDSNINNCSFLEDNEHNELHLYLYDTQRRVHHYRTQLKESKNGFESVGVFKPAEGLEGKTYSNITNLTFYSTGNFIAVCSKSSTTNVLLFGLDSSHSVYNSESSLQIDGIVNAVHFDEQSKKLFAHTLNGCVHELKLDSHGIRLGKLHVRLPHPAMQLLSYGLDTETGIVALSDNQSLYIDDQHIADYVTSICLEGSYLAFTKQSSLFLLKLSTRTVDDERQIESGGKLIAICSGNSRTVLQMPRGNLETIYPRLLLIDRVGKWLDGHEYARVMDLLVKQRINLNIICDHDLSGFAENVGLFVESVSNVQWLNLFLSELKNEDITQTMYANSYTNSPRNYPTDFEIEHKVNYICGHMLAHMENAKDPQRFTLPIITAKVKMGNLEAALNVIWNLKKQENNSIAKQSEEALKYLLYLVDVNELYNVALGTYDFGLVLFVAQKSQRDPREFLPFLNELKELELDYRKFKIDEHLKRHVKAITHLSKCNDPKYFEEAMEFVVRHQLYEQALECYKNSPSSQKRVSLAYADFLRAAGKLDNASLFYERGGDLTQALRCAKHVLDWERVLCLAQKENPSSVADVALSLVPALQEKRMHSEAFVILKTYGNDFLEALNCLLKGNIYIKAISEVHLHEQDSETSGNLIDDVILPHLIEYVELLRTNLKDSENTFIDYKTRLLDVREQRERQGDDTALNGFANDQGFDESDLLSDTTSMRSSHYTGSSRGTGKTFRSSKNRRKHERKHFSLKPGNPFEDIALIDALYNHVTKVFEQQTHLSETCKALVELNRDGAAAELQRQYEELLAIIQNSLDEIWIAELTVGAQNLAIDTNMNFKLYQNEQRYALLDPIKRQKPQIKADDWDNALLT